MDNQLPYKRRGQYQSSERPRVATPDVRDRMRGQQATAQPQPAATAPVPARTRKVPKLKLPKLSLEQTAVVIAAIMLLMGAGYGLYAVLKPRPPIPPAIRKQVDFGVFIPADKSILKIDKNTIAYDSKTEVLSLTGVRPSGTKVSFSEQATPSSFVDIPQVYDKLVASLQPYATFDSVNGKVALTHPKELAGHQSAVLNGQGTLMFVRPDHDMSDQEWRQVFNNLHLVR